MLTILPIKDNDILCKIKADENTVVLMCMENEERRGYIALKQIGYVLDIVEFEIFGCESIDKITPQHLIIGDSIIRSTGSYALNHACFYLESSNSELFLLLSKFGFEENNNKSSINLQQLFKVCKN